MDDWVKTEERVPEKDADVWIYRGSYVEEACWNHHYECWDDADGDDYKYDKEAATHWMYRRTPAPPTD